MPLPRAGQEGSLREAFASLLGDYGHYVVYVRRNPNIRCSYCYNPDTQEGGTVCTYCLSTGYLIQYEKHLCRITNVSPRGRRGNLAGPSPFGELGPHPASVYLPHSSYPVRGDMIFDVVWNVERDSVPLLGEVSRLIGIYEIGDTEAFRFDKGKITYHAAYCQQRDVNISWYEMQLRSASYVPIGTRIVVTEGNTPL